MAFTHSGRAGPGEGSVGAIYSTDKADVPKRSTSMVNVSRSIDHALRICGRRVLLIVFALLASLVCGSAEPIGHDPSLVDIFFSKPLPAEQSGDGGQTNAVLADVFRSSSGPTILLVSDGARASLLTGADRTSFGTAFPLAVQAYSLHLSGNGSGQLWIGGYSKPHHEIYGRRTFAYLAKVDGQGHLIWEREFGGQTERRIQSIAPLPSGDVVVSATDDRKTWLAKISGTGDLVWELDVGVGKGSAVAAVGDDIVLAGIEAGSDVEGYREDVSAWSFGQSGEQLRHWAIREGINRIGQEYAEDVQIAKARDSVYIISKWGTFAPFRPPEVAKLDPRTGVSWRKELLETINGEGNRAHVCTLAVTALSNGDILIACRSAADEIKLLRLNAANGDLATSTFRFPTSPENCDKPWSPASLMLEESQKTVWLFGSPRFSDKRPCGWIGEVLPPAVIQ